MRLITGGLRLVYDSPTNQSEFPLRFSLNFTEFDISFCRTFVRLGDPSARSQTGVYVLDQVSQQPRLVDSIREEVIIKNDNKKYLKIKILALKFLETRVLQGRQRIRFRDLDQKLKSDFFRARWISNGISRSFYL